MVNEETSVCTPYPVLVLISGPSAVGKDTIARGIIAKRPDDFYFVVTATTRKPRDGEIDGYDYTFVSHNEFARMIEHDEMLEYAVVYNDYKGVPKQQIQDALESGKNVIMRVDVQGAATVRELLPEVITAGARLLAPRPNPFNPSTTLRFHLAASQAVQLDIYDVRGQHVARLEPDARDRFRFLHVSTDEVYGSLGETGLFRETTQYAPNSPYAASKAGSDHLVRAFHHTYGMPVLTTNCSNNFPSTHFECE